MSKAKARPADARDVTLAREPSAGARRLEYMPIDELRGAHRNPKKHTPDIPVSIERFGYVEPMILDERTGRLVAGHGRKDALLAMAKAGLAEVPDGIRVDEKGAWLVPIIRGWSSKDDTEAEAYLIASNRLTEAGGWDDGVLAKMLGELDAADALLGVGFDQDQLTKLLDGLEPEPAQSDLDDAPEVAEKDVWVRPGELFALGEHRLLCGDSTKIEDVARLMAGERAGLMNTDPPYGVTYANDDRPHPGVAKPRVANDELSDAKLQSFLEQAFRVAKTEALKDNAAWYMWHAHLTQGYFAAAAAAAAAAAKVVLHRQIIWVKPVLLLGRGQYHWKHEPCFMGWVKEHQPPDYGEGNGERTQTTVWEVAGVGNAERKQFDHSTPKPVRLFEIPIIKHLLRKEIAYEPFSGSGPQVIAAEMTGRRCFAIEIEPRFVQVTIERWEKFTGLKATKLSTEEVLAASGE